MVVDLAEKLYSAGRIKSIFFQLGFPSQKLISLRAPRPVDSNNVPFYLITDSMKIKDCLND